MLREEKKGSFPAQDSSELRPHLLCCNYRRIDRPDVTRRYVPTYRRESCSIHGREPPGAQILREIGNEIDHARIPSYNCKRARAEFVIENGDSDTRSLAVAISRGCVV